LAAAIASLLVGTGATLFATEVIRWLFNVLIGMDRPIQPAIYPRTISAVTGIVERILFTPVAALLLAPGENTPNNVPALAALCGGYVILRGFIRDRRTETPGYTTIHAL